MSITNGHQNQTRAIKAHLERMERNLHTALPGIVVSYDPNSETADVRPGLRRAVPSADNEDLDVYKTMAVCPHVPVLWPRGQGISIVGALSPGDTVMLLFSERDFSDFYESGDVSDPQFAELHALNGAVCIPACVTRAKPAAPSDAAARGSVVDAILQAIAACTPSPQETGLASIKSALAAYTTSKSTILKLGG